jgi:hypothetical protein
MNKHHHVCLGLLADEEHCPVGEAGERVDGTGVAVVEGTEGEGVARPTREIRSSSVRSG